MRKDRRTLPSMDPEVERLMALVCDVVLEQDGDLDAVLAILARELSGTELLVPDNNPLAVATILAVGAVAFYTEPKLGPQIVRAKRDRLRRLVPVDPSRRRWNRWGATG